MSRQEEAGDALSGLVSAFYPASGYFRVPSLQLSLSLLCWIAAW
jgi:hypothetical protein